MNIFQGVPSLADNSVAAELQKLNSKWYDVRDAVRGEKAAPKEEIHVTYSGRIIATADSWAIAKSVMDVIGAALNAVAASKLENAGPRVNVTVINNGPQGHHHPGRGHAHGHRNQRPFNAQHPHASTDEAEDEQKKNKDEVPGVMKAASVALLAAGTVLLGQAYRGWTQASEDRAFAVEMVENLESTEEYHAGYDVAHAVSKLARHGSIEILRREEASFRTQTLNMVALLTFSAVSTAGAFGNKMPLVRIGLVGVAASALLALFRYVAFDPARDNKNIARRLVFSANKEQAQLQISREDFKAWLNEQHTVPPSFVDYCSSKRIQPQFVLQEWDLYREGVLGYDPRPQQPYRQQPYQQQPYQQQPYQQPAYQQPAYASYQQSHYTPQHHTTQPPCNPYANATPAYVPQQQRTKMYPDLQVNVNFGAPSAPPFDK